MSEVFLFFGYSANDEFSTWDLFDGEDLPVEYKWLETDRDLDNYLLQRYAPTLSNPYENYLEEADEKAKFVTQKFPEPYPNHSAVSKAWYEEWYRLQQVWKRTNKDAVDRYFKARKIALGAIKGTADYGWHCAASYSILFVQAGFMHSDSGEVMKVNPSELTADAEDIASVKKLAEMLGLDTSEEPKWLLATYAD